MPALVEDERGLVADDDLVLGARGQPQVPIAGGDQLLLVLRNRLRLDVARDGLEPELAGAAIDMSFVLALLDLRRVGELALLQLALGDRHRLLQGEDGVVRGALRLRPLGIGFHDLPVLHGGGVPLFERVEDLRVVEAHRRGALALRERVEVLAVDVARQPVGGSALRLDRFLVVVLHQLAQRRFRQIARFGQSSLLRGVRLGPSALRPVLSDQPIHLRDHLIAPVQLVVGEQDLLLPGGRFRVARGARLQDPVHADGLLEFAVVEVGGRQPLDGLHGIGAGLLRQIRDGAVDRVDVGVRKDDVLERFLAELHPVATGLALRIGDHFLELRDGRSVRPGVVVAPGELVERERVQLRQVERGGLLEGLPRPGQIVGGEEVLAGLNPGVGDETALRVLRDQRGVVGDSAIPVAALVEVVARHEEHFVAALVRRVPIEHLLVEADGLPAVPVAAARVELRLLALPLVRPFRDRVVVIADFLKACVARLLPPELGELEVEVGTAIPLRHPRDDDLQILDQLVALAIGFGVGLAIVLQPRRRQGRRREGKEERCERAQRHSSLPAGQASLTV